MNDLADEHRAANADAAYQASGGQYGAPGDQLRERIEALADDMAEAIDSGYYGGSEYEDAAARLRAVLDETR